MVTNIFLIINFYCICQISYMINHFNNVVGMLWRSNVLIFA